MSGTVMRRLLAAVAGFVSFVVVVALVLSLAARGPDDLGFGWYLTAICLGLTAGIAVSAVVRLAVDANQRLLGRMALRNLERRKRNTALVVIGLLVGSAIISSSLVVGDSLDATLQSEFTEALDETDIVIFGDSMTETGLSVWLNESRAREFVSTISEDPDIDAASIGIHQSVTLKSEVHRSVKPDAHWLAMDSQLQLEGTWKPIGGLNGVEYTDIESGKAVVNTEAAEDLSLVIGDVIEIGWSEFNEFGQLDRGSVNLTVQAIVSEEATGFEHGGHASVFTTLEQAQEIVGRQGEVNRIALSAKGGLLDAFDATERVMPRVNSTLDEILLADDVGLVLETDAQTSIINIMRSTATGLLSEDEVVGLRENLSTLAPGMQMSELLLAPIANIAHEGVNLSGLISSDVTSTDSGNSADWYGTPSGLSVQLRSTSQWFQWIPPDEHPSAILDVASLGDSAALSLHSQGVRYSNLDEDISSRDVLIPAGDGELVALAVSADSSTGMALRIDGSSAEVVHGATSAEEDIIWNRTLLDLGAWSDQLHAGEIAIEGSTVYIRLAADFDSRTCSLSLSALLSNSAVCSVQTDPAGLQRLAQVGGVVWDVHFDDLVRTSSRLAGAGVSGHALGLPEGEIKVTGGDGLWLDASSSGGGMDEVWVWNGTGFESSSLFPPTGATAQALSINGQKLRVSAADGVLLNDDGAISGRIPYQRSLDAFNEFPLVALAVTGSGAGGLPEPAPGEVFLTGWAATGIALAPPEPLNLLGAIPAARGLRDSYQLNYTQSIPFIPSPPGEPGLGDLAALLVNMSDAQELLLASGEQRNMLLLAPASAWNDTEENRTRFNNSLTNISAWLDQSAGADSAGVSVFAIKSIVRERTKDAGASFSILFLIFGSFVIFAGILLVINLFVMLGDERKPEMGMMRALGMQRSDLRAMFTYEGALIGLFSSALGSVLGIGIGWALMAALDRVLADIFEGNMEFGWEWHSLLTGFSVGFIVTWTTLFATAVYISRLNVVAAMRDIPSRLRDSLPWWSVLVSLVLIMAAVGSAALAFTIGDKMSGSMFALWLAAGFLFLIGFVPPLFLILRVLLPESIEYGQSRISRQVLLPRLVMTVLGTAMFTWGIWEDPLRADMEPGSFSFIILGLFLVAAGVLLLTSLAPAFARLLARLGARLSRKMASVLPTALAYPLATPFRTAMTMGMFSLVIFSVVVLSGYSALLNSYLGDAGENARGEWEIIAFGMSGGLELEEDTDEWNLGEADVNEFDAIAMFRTEIVQVGRLDEVDRLNNSKYTGIRGFDASFSSHGGLPLSDWAPALGVDQTTAWQRVLDDETLCVIDYTLAVEEWVGEGGEVRKGMGLNIGDAILVSDPYNPAINVTLYVGGVLEEESGWMAPGIFVNHTLARDRFDADVSSVWFSLPEHVPLEQEKVIVDELQYALIEEGAYIFSIEAAFQELQAFIFSMFGLLQAFLALGLAVGIAGLGVITIRNVSERQHQTGILRALGFQREMVVAGYLVELTWISLLGILNGALIGIGFHWQLYKRFLEEEGAEFVLPWGQITAIIIGAYLLTLLSTAWPVRMAASVHPAEALRDAE